MMGTDEFVKSIPKDETGVERMPASWPDEKLEYDDAIMALDIPFHVGQYYAHKGASQIVCKQCGSDKFEVAQGDYVTAIRCPACKWEMCIHEG